MHDVPHWDGNTSETAVAIYFQSNAGTLGVRHGERKAASREATPQLVCERASRRRRGATHLPQLAFKRRHYLRLCIAAWQLIFQLSGNNEGRVDKYLMQPFFLKRCVPPCVCRRRQSRYWWRFVGNEKSLVVVKKSHFTW